MRDVSAAIRAIIISGDGPASPALAWCSASQYRPYPRRSTNFASAIDSDSASAGVPPARIEEDAPWWRSDGFDGSWSRQRGRSHTPGGLTKLELETRLAVEMAVNEENERAVLEGELALLELEWKEAEEIAAIADRLGMPEEVDAQLEELRRRNVPGAT